MTFNIVFEDLPKSTRRTSDSGLRHADAAMKLKAQPNKWARVQKRKKRGDAATAAYQIRNGILAAFRPAGTFEAKSVTVGSSFFVYARYIGDGKSPDVNFSGSDGLQ